jgi:hypothetical protein
LRRIAAGTPARELSSRERSDAAELCKRGLLIEVGDDYEINGSIWKAYVQGQP